MTQLGPRPALERHLHYAPGPEAAAKLSRLWQSEAENDNVVSIRTVAA